MSGEGALGEAVLDLNADANDLRQSMTEAKTIVEDAFEQISGVVGTGTVAVIAAIAASVAGAVAGMKIGLDAAVAWGSGLHELNELFGMSAEDAATFAAAFEHVGLNVEDVQGQLSIFIRNLEASRVASANAVAAYSSALVDLTTQHNETLQSLLDDWTQTQADSKERGIQIETDLAESIVKINTDLGKQLTSMRRSRTKELSGFAKDEAKAISDAAKQTLQIETDLGKSITKLNNDTNKSLAQVDADTRTKLSGNLSQLQRQQLLDEAEAKKKQISDDAKDRAEELQAQADERKQAIADAKAERLADIADRRKEAREEYDYQVALQKQQAEDQIKAAEKAADKQTAAIEKALQKQSDLYDKQVAKEDAREEAQLKKLDTQLAKADLTNPVQKALKTLGISMDEIFGPDGSVRPVTEFLPKMMDAFQKMPDGVAKSSVALNLFGRGGAAFIEFLNMGSSGLDAMNQQVKALGAITDYQKIHDYSQAWNDFGFKIQMIWVNIGSEVLPIAKEMLDTASKFVSDNMPAIRAAIQQFFDWLKPVMETLGDAIKTGDWSVIGDQFNKWVNDPGTKKGINDTVFALGEIIANALTFFVQTSAKVLTFLTELVLKMTTWALSPEGISALKGFVTAFTAGLKEAFKDVNWIDILVPDKNAFANDFWGLLGHPFNLYGNGYGPTGGGSSGIRDAGGPVSAGSSYLIGVNRRPEIFTPGVSGMVSPLTGARTINVAKIEVNGARDPKQTAVEVRNALRQMVWE